MNTKYNKIKTYCKTKQKDTKTQYKQKQKQKQKQYKILYVLYNFSKKVNASLHAVCSALRLILCCPSPKNNNIFP